MISFFVQKNKYASDLFARSVFIRLAQGLVFFFILCLWLIWIPLLEAAEVDANRKTQVVDRIVAIVNEDIILLSEIEEWLKLYETQIRARDLPARTEQEMLFKAREEVIEERIDERLTAQQAASLGIRVDDDEVDAALEQAKKNMMYTDEELLLFLDEMGLSLETYREQIRNQIRRARVLSQEVKAKIVITEEDILTYYNEHKDRFKPVTRYHLRNIIMQPSDSREKEAMLEKLQHIHQQLLEGASFETMAREHSQSSFADKGGDLGFFELADLSPQIRDALETMRPGEITPVLETSIGLQIFYLEDIVVDAGQTVDTVSDEIRQVIYEEKLDEKFSKWVTSLRENSHIKIIR